MNVVKKILGNKIKKDCKSKDNVIDQSMQRMKYNLYARAPKYLIKDYKKI